MSLLVHIARYEDWKKAQKEGEYRTSSLAQEGFIHCSTLFQVVGVANTMFHGEKGLVLLCLDPILLEAEVRYEDCYQTGQAFPHLYGPLNLDAVVDVLDFRPDSDGKFALPEVLAGDERSLRCDYPILEYDPAQVALIEPGELLAPIDIPEHCVLCFFQEVITKLREEGQLQPVKELKSEIGPNPIYELEIEGQRLAVCHPGVGAPMAAGFMDELIALGCRHFIVCGGAGVLNGEFAVGHVIVPAAAVRDEGTSYHYLPPAREVAASPAAVTAIEQALQKGNVDYVVGKSWTTDGIYRETPGKIALRRQEGCLTVEMEAAAFFAVARFRGVTVGQILYGGDDVSSEKWDSRHWYKRTDVREKLFWLAAEACLAL